MGPKNIILLATAAFIATVFYLKELSYFSSANTFSMSPSSLILHISASQTELRKDDVPKFTVTISNLTAKPITVLTWNTPLDPKAAVLGIFKAVETDDPNQKIIEGPKIMFRRVTPPPRTDLIEIPPSGGVTVEVALSGFPLEKGKSYKMRVEGRWMSAWPIEKDKVSDDMLEAFGAEDEMVGAFRSNEETISIV